MKAMEYWKDVVDYEGLYQVSNEGRVKRLQGVVTRSDGKCRTIPENVLVSRPTIKGYPMVQLCKNGVPKAMTVHRLVAIAFVGNPSNYPIVNHLDSNPCNNTVENLEWTTSKGNTEHCIAQGRLKELGGGDADPENHPKLEEARKLIEQGMSMREVSKKLHICRNLLAKHGIKSNHGLPKSS